ncbi:PDDEXK nuclease domain-containing protein, partial [Terrimonas ginsenosidimutans]|uniref:PDDEXK nuclease domain-containing protein n=1 Tax=Terrimonas ginsenosidimutans TaxID=2908004 RepID=UPI00210772B2
ILQTLKEKIQHARQRAMLAVNGLLLSTYWEIGITILTQQKQEGWGAGVINRLIEDLRKEFPDMRGLSIRNVKYMRAFAQAYPNFGKYPQNSKDHENQADIIVQPVAAQLPWTHHQVIIDKAKTDEERYFYIQQAASNGWSRKQLAQEINSKLYLRQGNAITNFDNTLPKLDSALANETFKNPYIFDFLHASEQVRGLGLEKALVQQIKNFILELGRGFAFIGNQFKVKVGETDVSLDLLFFHYRLNCFIVFDLKIGEFKPEFAGKLNFYTTVVDEEIKLPEHKPTIGVLLCKSSDQTMVKYSLKNIKSPLGVSTFELLKDLPQELKPDMPSVEELEEEIEKEIKMYERELKDKQ